MTAFVVSITIALALFGTGVFIWSIANTRKKYYKEYVERKKND